jgi:hypothetical protein
LQMALAELITRYPKIPFRYYCLKWPAIEIKDLPYLKSWPTINTVAGLQL